MEARADPPHPGSPVDPSLVSSDDLDEEGNGLQGRLCQQQLSSTPSSSRSGAPARIASDPLELIEKLRQLDPEVADRLMLQYNTLIETADSFLDAHDRHKGLAAGREVRARANADAYNLYANTRQDVAKKERKETRETNPSTQHGGQGLPSPGQTRAQSPLACRQDLYGLLRHKIGEWNITSTFDDLRRLLAAFDEESLDTLEEALENDKTFAALIKRSVQKLSEQASKETQRRQQPEQSENVPEGRTGSYYKSHYPDGDTISEVSTLGAMPALEVYQKFYDEERQKFDEMNEGEPGRPSTNFMESTARGTRSLPSSGSKADPVSHDPQPACADTTPLHIQISVKTMLLPALITLANKNSRTPTEVQRALHFAEQAMELANKENAIALQGRCAYYIGVAIYIRNKDDDRVRARDYFVTAAERARGIYAEAEMAKPWIELFDNTDIQSPELPTSAKSWTWDFSRPPAKAAGKALSWLWGGRGHRGQNSEADDDDDSGGIEPSTKRPPRAARYRRTVERENRGSGSSSLDHDREPTRLSDELPPSTASASTSDVSFAYDDPEVTSLSPSNRTSSEEAFEDARQTPPEIRRTNSADQQMPLSVLGGNSEPREVGSNASAGSGLILSQDWPTDHPSTTYASSSEHSASTDHSDLPFFESQSEYLPVSGSASMHEPELEKLPSTPLELLATTDATAARLSVRMSSATACEESDSSSVDDKVETLVDAAEGEGNEGKGVEEEGLLSLANTLSGFHLTNSEDGNET